MLLIWKVKARKLTQYQVLEWMKLVVIAHFTWVKVDNCYFWFILWHYDATILQWKLSKYSHICRRHQLNHYWYFECGNSNQRFCLNHTRISRVKSDYLRCNSNISFYDAVCVIEINILGSLSFNREFNFTRFLFCNLWIYLEYNTNCLIWLNSEIYHLFCSF